MKTPKLRHHYSILLLSFYWLTPVQAKEPSQAEFPTNGLVACYPLDANADDIRNKKQHGKNLRAKSARDRFGRDASALKFNGIGQHLTLPIDINPSNMPELTMACWVKIDFRNKTGTHSASYIIGNDNGEYDRSLLFDVWSGHYKRNSVAKKGWAAFVGSKGTFNSGYNVTKPWVFLAVSYGKNQTTLSVNGVEFKTGATQFDQGMNYLMVAKNSLHRNLGFRGMIDDIFIYKRALSKNELRAIQLYGTAWIDAQKKGTDSISLPKKMQVTTATGTQVNITVTSIGKDSIKATLESGKNRQIKFSQLSREDQVKFQKHNQMPQPSVKKHLQAVIYNGKKKELVSFTGEKSSIDINDSQAIKVLDLTSLGSSNLKSLTLVTSANGEKLYYKQDGTIFVKGSRQALISVIDAISQENKPIKALYLSDGKIQRMIDPDGSIIYESKDGNPFWQVKRYNINGNFEGTSILEKQSDLAIFHHPDGRSIKIYGWLPHNFATPDGISVYKGGKYALLGYNGQLLIPPLYAKPLKYLGNKKYQAQINETKQTITLK